MESHSTNTPIDPKYEETFKVFSRLLEWKIFTIEEPVYSFACVIPEYWASYGTPLEEMFLNRLRNIWETEIRQFVTKVYANHLKRVAKPKSFKEFQQDCMSKYKKDFAENSFFLKVLEAKAWMQSEPLEYDS